MNPTLTTLCLFCILCLATVPAASADLRGRIDALIRDSRAEKVAVVYRDLQTGRTLEIEGSEPFHAASTMKLPVMLDVYRLVAARVLSLDDQLAIHTDFKSLADGSVYNLSPDDDADTALYKQAGESGSVRDLVERMITKSSNLATNLLIDRVGADHVSEYMRTLGAPDVHVLRGVMDDKAFEKGLNNMVTARGLARLLTVIAEGRAVSRSASDEMVRILLAQEHNNGIPAGLPSDWRVAHKTGWFTGTTHDAAIVYPPGRKPYILVILSRGIPEEARANRLIADISRAVHDEIVGAAR